MAKKTKKRVKKRPQKRPQKRAHKRPQKRSRKRKPRVAHSDRSAYIHPPRNYADFYRRTAPYHAYTFRLPNVKATKADIKHVTKSKTVRVWKQKKSHTPKQIRDYIKSRSRDYAINRRLSNQQMSAITRVWYGTKHKAGIGRPVLRVEQNRAQFCYYKNANRSAMLRKLKTTSKGFFIWRPNCAVWTKGKGLNLEIVIQPLRPPKEVRVIKPIRIEVFLPFPRGVIIPKYIAKVYDMYTPAPGGISIGVRGAKGTERHDNVSGLDYIKEELKAYEERGMRHPFTGVYFYWY